MKRAIFKNGEQKRFICNAKYKLKFNWNEFASKLNINENTLSKSYCFETSSMPYELFKKINTLVNKEEKVSLKDYNIKIKEIKNPIGRKVFGESRFKLNSVKINFENKKLNIDTKNVKFSEKDLEKGIILPKKISPELAEEVGMHLGDGFLSSSRYKYRLKGNQITEREYYIDYIKPLYKKLYNLELNLKDYFTSFGFEIKSKALWEFKSKVLGIKTGKKENIEIPKLLKINDKKILSSLIKGIMDTDGCISFKSKYGYSNYYPVISITLYSNKLVNDIEEILRMLGFTPRRYITQKKYSTLILSGIGSLRRYEELIGWSSYKNLNKVNEWKNNYPELYGGCGVTVARQPVALNERVRLPPSALNLNKIENPISN